jgi:hypothetical protein
MLKLVMVSRTKLTSYSALRVSWIGHYFHGKSSLLDSLSLNISLKDSSLYVNIRS